MSKTLLNKDGESWCPTCGTVFDGSKVLRPGNKPHAQCPEVGLDRFGNVRTGEFLKEAPAHGEVA